MPGCSFSTPATVFTTVIVKGMKGRKQHITQDSVRTPIAMQMPPRTASRPATNANPATIISDGLKSSDVHTTHPGATHARAT